MVNDSMNAWYFLGAIIIDVTAVFIAARLGRDWLMGVIITNLLLIGVFGAKLVSVLGIVTNVGNVFYACVFLATYFIIEHYGKPAALQTIWYSVGFMILFAVLSQFAAISDGSILSTDVNNAISQLFAFSPAVFIASILAFIYAQYVNITLYAWVKKRIHNKWPWVRSVFTNSISQLLDSVLFFSIAFYNQSGLSLVKAILAGWAIKVLVMCLAAPTLAFDLYLRRKK